jgi:hypothetical protein
LKAAKRRGKKEKEEKRKGAELTKGADCDTLKKKGGSGSFREKDTAAGLGGEGGRRGERNERSERDGRDEGDGRNGSPRGMR